MKDLQYAIFILKSEIRNQEYLLNYGHILPETKEKIKENLLLLGSAMLKIENLIKSNL